MSTPSPSPGPNPNAAQSFSWAFSVKPDAASAADSQFTTFDQNLTDADINIRGAKDLMSHQSAMCIPAITDDYSNLSDVCADVSAQAAKLRSALSAFAGAMGVVREKYQTVVTNAQAGGLSVSGDYTNCTVTVQENAPSEHRSSYYSALSQLNYAQSLHRTAEQEFSTALANVDTSVWEKTLQALMEQLKGSYIPNSEHPAASTTSALGGWSDLASNVWRAGHAWFHNGHYAPPEGFAQLSKWKQFTAKGDLSNWTRYARHRAGEAPKIPGAVERLEKVGKVAGVVAAVAEGGINAYNSYQSDTINHPDMGEGEKITRAGVKGVATGVASWAGATYGAQLGAAIGAAGGPVGIVVGGVVGGIVGGVVTSKVADAAADWFNDKVVDGVFSFFGKKK